MDFTGERVVPGQVTDDLMNEHLVRYAFASGFVREGMRILDAGCGTGYGTYALAQDSPLTRVTGVDISPEAIEYARLNYVGDNCVFTVADLERSEWPSESFDLVVSFEVIEHIKQPEIFLRCIAEALSKEGCLIVSTPNRKMYSDAIPGYHNPFHVKEFYHEEFVSLLKEHFSQVTLYAQDFLQGMVVSPLLGHVPRIRPGDITAVREGVQAHPDDASYFIAVCSFQEMQLRNPLVCAFSQSNILAEKDRYIAALVREVQIRDESVAALQVDIARQALWLSQSRDEVRERDIIIRALQNERGSLLEWVTRLEDEVCKRDEATGFLQRENEVKSEWIEKLQIEVEKRDKAVEHILAESAARGELIEKLQAEVSRCDGR